MTHNLSPETRQALRQHEMIAPGAGSAELLTRSPARNKASAADLAPQAARPGSLQGLDCPSRITLEIVSVRVERLQDISEADALAEGVKITIDRETLQPLVRISGKSAPAFFHKDHGLAVAEFASLWESINGPGSWAQDPWVWVIEFKKAQP